MRLKTIITEQANRQWEMQLEITGPNGKPASANVAKAVAEQILTCELQGNTPDAFLQRRDCEIDFRGKKYIWKVVFHLEDENAEFTHENGDGCETEWEPLPPDETPTQWLKEQPKLMIAT